METAIESFDLKATAAHEVETVMAALNGEELDVSVSQEGTAHTTSVKMEAADVENLLDDLWENSDEITEAIGGVNGSNAFPIDSKENNLTAVDGTAGASVRVKTEPTDAAGSTLETLALSKSASTPVIRLKTEFSQMGTGIASSSGTDVLEEQRSPRPSIRIKSDLMATPVKDERIDEPALPENFFDDLMDDEAGRRAELLALNALTLKKESIGSELQLLERSRHRKKQKKQKSKKKSKKRSRTRSPDSVSPKRTRHATYDSIDPMAFNIDSFQNDISGQDFVEMVTGTTTMISRSMDTGYKEIMLKKVENSLENTVEDDIVEVLTPSGKQMKSIERGTKALRELKRLQTSLTLLYSQIVCKKPNLDASVKYRSPMHKRCMQYSFNSLDKKIDCSFWGLEDLAPSVVSHVRAFGASRDLINDMLKTMKLPDLLDAANSGAAVEEEAELVEEASSSLYRNVMTQTERGQTHDIGLMTKPLCVSHETQTSDSGGSMKQLARGNDTLQRMFEILNPNQFLALADFTELMISNHQEPMDLYNVRQRLVEIFTSAEKPANEAPPPTRPYRLADPRIAAQRPPPLLPETSAGRYAQPAAYEYAPPPPPLSVQQAMPGAQRHAMTAPQHHAIPSVQHHAIPVLQSRPLPLHVPNAQPYGAPAFYATQPHPQMQAMHNSNLMPNPAAQNNAFYPHRH